MGQLGFFDLSRRYEGLDVKDDPLVAIAAMVPCGRGAHDGQGRRLHRPAHAAIPALVTGAG